VEAGASSAAHSPKLLLWAALAAFALLVGSLVGLAAVLGTAPGCGGEVGAPLGKEVPKKLVPLYDEAAAEYKLGPKGPAVLAAVNFVETGFGTNMATSSAGANGWMAFLPSTWEVWGVDGDHDGDKDPYSAADGIFSAANYLHDSGAPGDWWEAIFAYNHAGWYVEKVLHYTRQFGAAGGADSVTTVGCAAAAPNGAVAKMLAEAERLSRLRPHTEYVWGGSHGISPTPPNGPFDCSSAVSHLLQVAGFENPTMDTIALLSWGKTGPGRWVTIFDKPYGGDAHTFIEFMPGVAPASERYWGTSGFVAPGQGPGFIPESVFDASYLSGFVQLHPPGL
jgi:Transglycosylase SLT domain